MTTAPESAGQPSRDDLTARIFRAFYTEWDLRTINSTTHVVVPKGTRVLETQPRRHRPPDQRPRSPGPAASPGRAREDRH
jgi:hypothetical protein